MTRLSEFDAYTFNMCHKCGRDELIMTVKGLLYCAKCDMIYYQATSREPAPCTVYVFGLSEAYS